MFNRFTKGLGITRRNSNRNPILKSTNGLATKSNNNPNVKLTEDEKNKLKEEISLIKKEIEKLKEKIVEQKKSITAEINLKEEKIKEINKKLNIKSFFGLFGGNKTKRKYKK